MAEVKRGAEFTHPSMLEPGWKPDIAAGQRYKDAPKARCVVTMVRQGRVWFRYASDAGSGKFTASIADATAWAGAEQRRA